MASEKVQTLTLTSLVGAKPIIYNWPKNKNVNIFTYLFDCFFLILKN